MQSSIRLFALAVSFVFVAVACSSSSSDEGSGGTGAEGAESGAGKGGGKGAGKGAAQGAGNGRFTCCINDAGYRCPDEDAVDQCSGGLVGVAECHAACAGDPACHDDCDAATGDPDPSACEADPTVSCNVVEGCSGIGFGDCTIDADCDAGEHCAQGMCFDNEAGSACTIDADCGSGNHCAQGCCYTNTAGTPCTIDADCGGGACVGGTCSGGSSTSSGTASGGNGATSTGSGEECPAFCEYNFDCCIGETCNDLGFCDPY